MSRLDSATPDERQELKEEIKSELRAEARRKKMIGCGACFVIYLLVIGLPCFFLARAAAKTGLVNVPGFTARYYKPSAPLRDVPPLAGSTTETILASLRAKTKYDPRAGTAQMPFTESELTTMLTSAVVGQGQSGGFAMDRVQVAVDQGVVELFGVMPTAGREVTLRARFVPRAVKGELQVDLNELMIGDYVVPPSFANAALSTLTKGLFDQISSSVSQLGTLDDIKLESKRLVIVLVPNLKK